MSIEIVKIIDYDKNLVLLIQEYKEKPLFKGIIEAENLQANDTETGIFEVRDNFWIDSAVGIQLDTIGEIQNETRKGKNDTDYRNAIKARIIVNNGSGEGETIIKALVDLYGATVVQLLPPTDANLIIYIDIIITEDEFNEMIRIVAAGVGLHISIGDSTPFVFFGDSDGLGFGKLSDDDYYLFDTNGNKVTDTNGDYVTVLVNESDPDDGGGLVGIWSTGS